MGKMATKSTIAVFALIAMLMVGVSLTVYNPKVYAQSTNFIVANVGVASTCTAVLTNTLINFGSLAPGSTLGPVNGIVDTDSAGNVDANILLSASNMINPANPADTFYITNTVWNPSYSTGLTTENAITALYPLLGSDTGIVVTPGNANGNVLYFGINVPNGQAAGSYTQNIYIENNC